MPWRLRRFATGLPKLVWSRLMAASLRLSGLTEIEGNDSLLTSMNFETPVFVDPETSRCIEWRDGRSRFARVAGLNAAEQSRKVAFSWPRDSAREADGGM
jgi:hypothetical protein